jgi:hypothetical protein
MSMDQFPGHPAYPAYPAYPAIPPPPPPAPPVVARRRNRALIVGLVTTALGFVEISYWSSSTVNGVVTECDYVNLAPLLFGPVAVLCGLVALARAGRTGVIAGRELGLGGLCVLVGAVHLLRAFGVVELLSSSPC